MSGAGPRMSAERLHNGSGGPVPYGRRGAVALGLLQAGVLVWAAVGGLVRLGGAAETAPPAGWHLWLAGGSWLAICAWEVRRRRRRNRAPTPWSTPLRAAVLVLSVALLAPLLAPYDPLFTFEGRMLQPPSLRFPLGTDNVGRDCLSRLLYGSRISLFIAFLSVGVAATVGTAIGAAAGLAGGRLEAVLVWIIDLFLALPRLVLMVTVLVLCRNAELPKVAMVAIVLGGTGWMPLARLVRADVRGLARRPFLLAARGLGLTEPELAVRHLLPNLLPVLAAHGAVLVGMTLLAEASLSFLGLGVSEPVPSWGGMMARGREYYAQWWLMLFPGLCVVAAVLTFHLLGESLRGEGRAGEEAS